MGNILRILKQLNISFERVAKKLGDTMMIAPETVPGLILGNSQVWFSMDNIYVL